MRPYDPAKPLISIHIPKCAGNALQEVLSGWYGRRFHGHYFNERENRMPRRVNLAPGLFGALLARGRGVCIHGHFNGERGFGVRDYYPEVDQFITIVRDPFELHLSNFFYQKRRGSDLYRDGKPVREAVDEDFDLKTYLDQRNRSFMLIHFPFELTLADYRERLEESFVYIGVAEDLQGSVDRLAEHLGFAPASVPRSNVSERTQAVPEGARERFIEANPVEWAVYDYAREHYRK